MRSSAILLTVAVSLVLLLSLDPLSYVHAQSFNVSNDEIIAGGNGRLQSAYAFTILSSGDILLTDSGNDTMDSAVKRIPVSDPSNPMLFRTLETDAYGIMSWPEDTNVIISDYTDSGALRYASIADTSLTQFVEITLPTPMDPAWNGDECRTNSADTGYATIMMDGKRTMWGVCGMSSTSDASLHGAIIVMVFTSNSDVNPTTYYLPFDNEGPIHTWGIHFSYKGHLIMADWINTVWRFEADELAASLSAAMESSMHIGTKVTASAVITGDATACGTTAVPNDAMLAGTSDDIYLITFNDCSKSFVIYDSSKPLFEGSNPYRYSVTPVDATHASVLPLCMHVKDGLLYLSSEDAMHRLTLSGVDLTLPNGAATSVPVTPLFIMLLLIIVGMMSAGGRV